jgi:hypothetical protein
VVPKGYSDRDDASAALNEEFAYMCSRPHDILAAFVLQWGMCKVKVTHTALSKAVVHDYKHYKL